MILFSKVLISLFLAFSCEANLTLDLNFTKSSDVKKEAKIEITATLKKYVKAFDSRDYDGIRQAVTDHFITATGGEKAWKQKFLPVKKQNEETDPQIKNLKIVERKKNTFVRFDTKDKMPEGQWFVMKKQDKSWFIDDLVNDFNPEL